MSAANVDYTDLPAQHAAAAVKSDTVELSHVTRYISFKTAGDLKVVTVGGETVVIPSGVLLAGVMHKLSVKQIFDTGTTAADIWVYW